MRSALVISTALIGGALLLVGAKPRTVASSGFDFTGLLRAAAPQTSVSGVSRPVASQMSPMEEVRQRLASAEAILGRKLVKTSWLRSIAENLRVGGAHRSTHLTGAGVDISTKGHDLGALYRALRQAGFTGFGFYSSHIHADIGGVRNWFGDQAARAAWRNFV